MVGGLTTTYAGDELVIDNEQYIEIASYQPADNMQEVDQIAYAAQADDVIYIIDTGELSGKMYAHKVTKLTPQHAFNLANEYSYKYSDNCLIRLCECSAISDQIRYKQAADIPNNHFSEGGLIRKMKFLSVPFTMLPNHKRNTWHRV